MDPNTLPLRKTSKVAVCRLRLDRENPRLVGEAEDAADEEIIDRLYRSAELTELLESISTNGYLDIEPLIVLSEPDTDLLTVLEGNRRLATLLLLREPSLAERIASREGGIRIRVPPVDDSDKLASFEDISVYRVASREDARSFIGFKHINGPARWDSYAKARYAAKWYKAARQTGTTLNDIARSIGDTHATIKRMVFAIYVLEQAESKKLFSIDDHYYKKFSFSHLYTALARSEYMDYLGLRTNWTRYDPSINPIPESKLDKLEKILIWIYGSKKDDIRPVIRSQNPDIRRLGRVLAHPDALLILEVKTDLDAAYTSTEAIDINFRNALINARDGIWEASKSLRAYDGHNQSLLRVAADIKETTEIVYERMLKKHKAVIDG